MKASIFSYNKSYGNTNNTFKTAKSWLFNTPERALTQAYNAAATIKAIEDKYFNSKKITAEVTSNSENVAAYLQADLERNLNTARLRLAEFKASRAVFGISNSVHLEKLAFVDQILDKYINEIKDEPLATVNTPTKTTLKKSKNTSDSFNTEIINTVSESTNSVPKSLGKTINRFKKELEPQTEAAIISKIRSFKARRAAAIKFMIVLVLVPLLTQQVSKRFLINPIVDSFKTRDEAQVFINSEVKEQAFRELQAFEEELKFDNLIHKAPLLSSEQIEEQVKEKATAIAQSYHHQGNSAISNVFADILAVFAFTLVILTNKKQLIVLKSFMDDILHGLTDTAKAFIIILFTDVFVGFHSPHGWEVVLEAIGNHLGLPANRNFIFLFIATFPVVLDAMFKFWVFRYLTGLSPSAVATYKNMNE